MADEKGSENKDKPRGKDPVEEAWKKYHKKVFMIYLALSPLFIFLGIKLLSPTVPFLNLPAMHFSLTDWDLGVSGFVERPGQSVLLLKMNNEPPGWDVAYERILTMDPEDGDILGQVVESRPAPKSYSRPMDALQVFS